MRIQTLVANPDPVRVISREGECLRRLMEGGLSFETLQMPISDEGMRRRLISYWLLLGHEPTPSQKLAREIMGKNFSGIEEAVQRFGLTPTEAQIKALAQVPFSEAELRACRNTHKLAAVFPLSILNIHEKGGRRFFSAIDEVWGRRSKDFVFMKDQGKVGWHLVRQTPVPDSEYKNLNDQFRLLGQDEEVPTARVLVYLMFDHYLATGKWLFPRPGVRCSSLYFSYNHAHIFYDYSDSPTIVISKAPDDSDHEYVGGLASAKKPV